jgi:ankyrin repeat protein
MAEMTEISFSYFQYQVCKELLSYGISPVAQDPLGRNAVTQAALSGRYDLLETMLQELCPALPVQRSNVDASFLREASAEPKETDIRCDDTRVSTTKLEEEIAKNDTLR